MLLVVPFVYEALVVRPRCRKPVVVAIRDEIEVNIKEVDEDTIPVAFKVGKDSYRWDGVKLWDFAYFTEARRPPLKVRAETVKENTLSPDAYKWSCSSSLAPFKNFWFSNSKTMARKHNLPTSIVGQSWLKDAAPLEEVVYRKFLDSNRLDIQNMAIEIASNYLICNGFLYHRVGEPRYEVITFGCGRNCSRAVFIVNGQNPNIADDCYFNAFQFDEAIKCMKLVSTLAPEKTNCGNKIQVLIPSAVQVKRNPRMNKDTE